MAEARKVFEQEIANVEQQIRVLRQRREHLRALLGTYSQPASSPAAAVASTATANGRTPQKQSPTSSEMARQIIRKHGPLAPAAIGKHIKEMYRTEPAKNLRGILFKKAAKKAGFVRMKDGRYDLADGKVTKAKSKRRS